MIFSAYSCALLVTPLNTLSMTQRVASETTNRNAINDNRAYKMGFLRIADFIRLGDDRCARSRRKGLV